MIRKTIVSAVLLAVASTGARAQPSADLVLRNGAIYTVDAVRSWAEAVAVANGKIVYVGPNRGVEPFITPQTRVVDLDGKMVLPSFHDSHVHMVEGGMSFSHCRLDDLKTPEDTLKTIRHYAQEHTDRKWVLGSGWQLPVFPDANPRRDLLDQAVPDRPAFFESADGHSAWVNSAALREAAVTKQTSDPPGGRIERDPATGEPSGTLREAAADLVRKYVPLPALEEEVAALSHALEMANRFGITSLQDADASDRVLEAYLTLDHQGKLSARVVTAMSVDPAKGEAQIAGLISRRARYTGVRLRATAVKIFADGVIESGTAALLDPYLNRPGNSGPMNVEPELLTKLVIALDKNNFQIHIHAIGDRAIRASLDAHEAARQANGTRDARHHIAHLELIEPEDIPRFRQLGVAANFQPLWAWRDPYIKDLTEPVLGPRRSRWLYPIESVLKSGAVVVAGSDWPVSSLNPLEAIQIAITRKGLEETAEPPWIPEERAELASMLASYTINGAWINREEKDTGSIETGKAADLIVLDRNLFTIQPEKIHETKVLLTLLEGRELFRDPSFAPVR